MNDAQNQDTKEYDPNSIKKKERAMYRNSPRRKYNKMLTVFFFPE